VAGFTVRPFNLGDAETIARIHVESWKKAYRDLMPADALEGFTIRNRYLYWKQRFLDGRHGLVLEKDGRVVGFADHGPSGDGKGGEIYSIYLEPEQWNKGGGSLLYRAAVEALREQGFRSLKALVLEGNRPAERFYAKHGLRDTGEVEIVRIVSVELPHRIFRGKIKP